ncbi:DUF3347 domain-containing protein [Zunongwangia sp. F260]|uniref:DUF3347 domain-containing protein n=1 Tax=Autumnicola lenta TaxID=3075593 RepID=A0ABU3CKI0_9FLAO|nr:DUF3347 domain-containing protein [Zunongwangia sp. F260]MDT0646465.1 DUF3347 domain-containing protein [Zunongwangia sp. F260]
MKNLKVNLGIAMLVIASLTAVSCKNNNEEGNVDNSGMDHENMSEGSEMMEGGTQTSEDISGGENQDSQTGIIVNDYLELKDALVADNSEGAAKAGESLVTAFENFDRSGYEAGEQQEMTEIIEDAREHAEHIAVSDMAHQREHFDILSIDLVDMLAITGSPETLYQQFCPMYNNNKGAIWLSTSEEIRNPYFGQNMLSCGEVQKEI